MAESLKDIREHPDENVPLDARVRHACRALFTLPVRDMAAHALVLGRLVARLMQSDSPDAIDDVVKGLVGLWEERKIPFPPPPLSPGRGSLPFPMIFGHLPFFAS